MTDPVPSLDMSELEARFSGSSRAAGSKAATNAIHLRSALDARDDVDTALAEWSARVL